MEDELKEELEKVYAVCAIQDNPRDMYFTQQVLRILLVGRMIPNEAYELVSYNPDERPISEVFSFIPNTGEKLYGKNISFPFGQFQAKENVRLIIFQWCGSCSPFRVYKSVFDKPKEHVEYMYETLLPDGMLCNLENCYYTGDGKGTQVKPFFMDKFRYIGSYDIFMPAIFGTDEFTTRIDVWRKVEREKMAVMSVFCPDTFESLQATEKIYINLVSHRKIMRIPFILNAITDMPDENVYTQTSQELVPSKIIVYQNVPFDITKDVETAYVNLTQGGLLLTSLIQPKDRYLMEPYFHQVGFIPSFQVWQKITQPSEPL